MALPKYAAKYKPEQLAYYSCKSRKCGGRSMHGLVSQSPWESQGILVDTGLYVTCLICETRQKDSYNWSHV